MFYFGHVGICEAQVGGRGKICEESRLLMRTNSLDHFGTRIKAGYLGSSTQHAPNMSAHECWFRISLWLAVGDISITGRASFLSRVGHAT